MNLFTFVRSQEKPFPLKQILITIRGMIKICFSFSHLFKQKKNGCLRELFLCEYFQCLHKNKNLKYKHLQEIAEEKNKHGSFQYILSGILSFLSGDCYPQFSIMFFQAWTDKINQLLKVQVVHSKI